MQILHIATQEPGYDSGGKIGTLQFSYALTHSADVDVDYVGPHINNNEIESWYNKLNYIDNKISTAEKAWTLLHFQFDRKYLSWKRLKIDFNRYDIIFVEFTKLDYVIRTIIKAGYTGKIVVRAHNVEKDYYRVNYKKNKSFMNLLRMIAAEKRERFMLENSDIALAITDNDKQRILDLYGLEESKVKICPVGVGIPNKTSFSDGTIGPLMKCLITGSLRFGPNSEATLWFINNVYPEVKDICEVTVAGFKPRDEIKEQCSKNGIRLIDSPETMQPYFEEAEIVLAPIFDGGGMKVKVAEAMSYGLPIVTTSHGAIGYKIQNGVNGYIADTAQGFIKAIRSYYEMSVDERKSFLESEWKLYTDNYSVLAIRDFCKSMIEDLN